MPILFNKGYLAKVNGVYWDGLTKEEADRCVAVLEYCRTVRTTDFDLPPDIVELFETDDVDEASDEAYDILYRFNLVLDDYLYPIGTIEIFYLAEYVQGERYYER